MKNTILLSCLLLFSFYSCTQNSNNAESENTMTNMKAIVSEEEKAINEAVMKAYEVISFEKGGAPDYETIKSIFMPEATLYNFRFDSLSFYLIDEFMAGFKTEVDAGNRTAFNEIELGGETEFFGNIGHRISTYASYINGAEEIGEKGVNSFQLLKVKGKWKINSIIWDIEKAGQSIPEKYLAKK